MIMHFARNLMASYLSFVVLTRYKPLPGKCQRVITGYRPSHDLLMPCAELKLLDILRFGTSALGTLRCGQSPIASPKPRDHTIRWIFKPDYIIARTKKKSTNTN